MAPKVSIIVTSYSAKSRPYLDLCMLSLANLNYPKHQLETIIVGHKDNLPQYEGTKTIAPEMDRFFPPVGLNLGIKHASPDSEFFLILNDDTILTKNSLTSLLSIYERCSNIGLLMPLSNDQQNRYSAMVGIPPGPKKLEELMPIADKLMNHDSAYPDALMFHETLCIYAFLLPRKTIETVGLFDEKLMGQDDIDYTLRISRSGLLNAVAFNSIIYHFGGATANHTFSQEDREKSMKLFMEKWNGPQQEAP